MYALPCSLYYSIFALLSLPLSCRNNRRSVDRASSIRIYTCGLSGDSRPLTSLPPSLYIHGHPVTYTCPYRRAPPYFTSPSPKFVRFFCAARPSPQGRGQEARHFVSLWARGHKYRGVVVVPFARARAPYNNGPPPIGSARHSVRSGFDMRRAGASTPRAIGAHGVYRKRRRPVPPRRPAARIRQRLLARARERLERINADRRKQQGWRRRRRLREPKNEAH